MILESLMDSIALLSELVVQINSGACFFFGSLGLNNFVSIISKMYRYYCSEKEVNDTSESHLGHKERSFLIPSSLSSVLCLAMGYGFFFMTLSMYPFPSKISKIFILKSAPGHDSRKCLTICSHTLFAVLGMLIYST